MVVILHQSSEQALAAAKRSADAVYAGVASLPAITCVREGAAKCLDAGILGIRHITPTSYFADCWELWGDGRTLVNSTQRLALVMEALGSCECFARTLGSAQLIAGFIERYAGCYELGAALHAVSGDLSGEALLGWLRCDSAQWGAGEFARGVMAFGAGAATDLADAEIDLLRVIAAYFSELNVRGLAEWGPALAQIASVMSPECVKAAGPLELTAVQERFLASLGCELPCLNEVVVGGLLPHVEPRLVFPSGATVVPAVVRDEALGALSVAEGSCSARKNVCVCAPSPFELYEVLAPSLSQSGIACGLKCRIPFLGTAFGRACSAVGVLVREEASWLAAATDFALSPFSGMLRREAQRLNTTLRADRLSTAETARALLRDASPTFSHFECLLLQGSAEALESLRAYAAGENAPKAARELVERDAIAQCERVVETLGGLGVPGSLLEELLSTLSVSVSWLATPSGMASQNEGKRVDASGVSDTSSMSDMSGISDATDASDVSYSRSVTFLPLDAMASLPPGSFDAVILADVSDKALYARSRSALDALAEKLGIGEARETLGPLRAAFVAAQYASRLRFSCVMPLRSSSQEDAYASYPFEEFMAAQAEAQAQAQAQAEAQTPLQTEAQVPLQAQAHVPIQQQAPTQRQASAALSSSAAVVEVLRVGTVEVPAILSGFVVLRGEEDVVSGVGRAFEVVEDVLKLSTARRGCLEHLTLRDYVRTVCEQDRVLPVLSPSALEAYLGCPYKWFVERRLRLNELDEGFGPLEQGSFAHAVYAAFYEAHAERGYDRVPIDSEGRRSAFLLFDEVFDDQVDKQPACGAGRLVAVNRAEALEVERLRELLRASIVRQSRLPEGFGVRFHELSIEPDEGIDYAGARVFGRVDRVDVNDEGRRFVVLDYKGSVDEHAAGFGEDEDEAHFALPRKIQALVYAQALRAKLDGLTCAGALYLSYRAKSDAAFAAGSFDEAAFDLGCFAKESSRVHMSFDAFLDMVERAVAPAVSALVSGDISCQPAGKHACEYCPVESCEGRMR